jgi:hypothetical protein
MRVAFLIVNFFIDFFKFNFRKKLNNFDYFRDFFLAFYRVANIRVSGQVTARGMRGSGYWAWQVKIK